MGVHGASAVGTQIINPNSCCRKINLLLLPNAVRAISADTALRLGIYFGLPAQFWLNLQNEYDLRRAASPAHKKLSPRAA